MQLSARNVIKGKVKGITEARLIQRSSWSCPAGPGRIDYNKDVGRGPDAFKVIRLRNHGRT